MAMTFQQASFAREGVVRRRSVRVVRTLVVEKCIVVFGSSEEFVVDWKKGRSRGNF